MPEPLPPALRAFLDALWRLPIPRWRAFLAELRPEVSEAARRISADQRAALEAEVRELGGVLRYIARRNPGLTVTEAEELEARLPAPTSDSG